MSQQLPKTISAWQLMNFLRPGSTTTRTTTTADIMSELHLTTTRRMPCITRPDQILIKVKAVSLNPVDLLLIYGYGSSSFNLLRRFTSPFGYFGLPYINNNNNNSDFPFTPGRDFSGQIIDIGPDVITSNLTSTTTTANNNIKLTIGTNIAGATWPFLSSTGSGALAEYIVCPVNYIAPLPNNVSYLHAAAIGYAGLTAWSALVNTGGIQPVIMNKTSSAQSQLSNNLILITGASGGVGLIAAQLAKLWGWRVHVTCPSDEKAISLMKLIQVEEIFPHPTEIPDTLKYDLILDCIRPEYINTETPFSASSSTTTSNSFFNNILPYIPPTLSYLNTSSNRSRYIILNPSLLHLTDYWGPFLGSGLALSQLILSDGGTSLNNCRNLIRWAFFQPNCNALKYLLNLLSNKQLIIPIDTVYNFNDVPKAFNRLYAKGVRGKLVIEFDE